MRALVWLIALAQGTGFAPFDVDGMVVAPPMSVATLSRKDLKGEPSRLAWSPDSAVLYIQSRDGVGAMAQSRHYQRRLGYDELTPLDIEPDWADSYWHTKVSEAAPGLPFLKIDVAVDRQRTRVAPLAGGFATAGSATGSDAAASYTITYVTLRYLGVNIGQWTSDEPKSGFTFGWGPAGSGSLAFVDQQGHLALLDKERRQKVITKSEHVLLPAWSPDGNYIAYFEKRGRSSYRLASVAIVRAARTLQ